MKNPTHEPNCMCAECCNPDPCSNPTGGTCPDGTPHQWAPTGRQKHSHHTGQMEEIVCRTEGCGEHAWRKTGTAF